MDLHAPKGDLSEDLARSLPRWIGWIPVLGKAGYRKFAAIRERRSLDNLFRIEPLYTEIYVPDRDSGYIQMGFLAVNFSSKTVEVDRAELHSLQVGGRGVGRTSEMLKAHRIVASQSTANVFLTIDLYPGDVKSVIDGISAASNLKSYPSASVRFHLTLVLLSGKERMRRTVEGTVEPRRCQIVHS